MRKTREQLVADEEHFLAPYAQKSASAAGRRHAEPHHPYRTDYQRDRARIIHSRAFRRLEYKTQVFLNGEGDHLRTRLTHTIEVASLSRSIARALGLNEDLSEAIALSHDLGHAPVGHAGEGALDTIMKEHGGFEHNVQSLRIVETIESRYPEFEGLNLSYEVLEGLRKHARELRRPASEQSGGDEEVFPNPSLEAQIANIADEITYYSHDLDDGIEHGLIDPQQLEALDVWRACRERVVTDFPQLSGKRFHGYLIRHLIDHQVEDVIESTAARIAAAGVETADAVRRCTQRLAGYSDTLRKENAALRKFLYQNLYYHPEVSEPNNRACAMVEAVFAHYLANPEELGIRTSERITRDGLHRTVCDYVSGMTDRFLMQESARIGAP